MFAKLKPFLPGERTRMILIAACIGVMAGLAIIVFREAVELVRKIIFVWGYEVLHISQGGWRRMPCRWRFPGMSTATASPLFCGGSTWKTG